MAQAGQERRLIGRAPEVELATRLLREMAAGTPRLLVLTGPAGVGKSTLAREITMRAARAGARILWGAGQEDLAIPYLPIAMAFEGLRDDGTPSPLVLEDDPTTSWARAADRLVGATEQQPIVLVMDDLHWADAASQALFLHLLVVLEHVAHTKRVRCLTVVTLRTPVDDDRTARTLSRIRREPGVQVLEMAGLDRSEVAQLVASVCSSRPSALVVERVAEATDGNPLLVQSLVRRGLAEHRLVERGGALALRDVGDHLAVDPSELDHNVMARLEQLSEPARRLLTIAALLGDEQPVDELLDVAGVPVAEADPLLDEAVAAELLLERGSRCSFAHPQVRRVLFHHLPPRQRPRLHLEIADVLERRHGEAGALPIAHHLVRAVGRVEPARIAHWCGLAAAQARAQGAWADASIAGEHALEALGDDAPWEVRADLHLLVTDAATRDFDAVTVVRHGRAAIELAAAHDDAERWGRALLPMARTLTTSSGDAGQPTTDPTGLLHEFLRMNPGAAPALRAEVLSLQSEILGVANRPDDALDAAMAARDLLTSDTDPEVVGLVHVAEGMARWAQLDLREAEAAYASAVAAAGVRPPSRPGVYAGVRRNLVRHLLGDVDDAWRDGVEMVELLEASQVWGEHAVAAAGVATTALAKGRFDEVERYAGTVERSARRTAYLQPLPIAMGAAALARALRGDGRGAYEAIDLGMGTSGVGARYRLAVDALLGDTERVQAAIDARPWRAPRPEAGLTTLPGTVLHAEVGLAIGHAAMVSEAAVPLRDAHQRGAVLAHGWAVLLSRLIGECAAAEDRDEAERWLAVAAEEADAMGLPVEAARVELARARLLASDPEVPKARVTEQAQRATAALDAVGALPLVAAARRIGTVAGAPGPVTRTILFTDLVDSTVLNVRAGDEAFLQLVREHNEVVRACLRRRAGVEFKHTGDGVAAWFTSPVDAVECAISINEDLDRASNLHPDYPLLVRCGLSSGEPLGNEGDLFGLSVVQAARLCAAAEAGEILVGPEIVGAARAHGIVFRRRGPMRLKGFPEPIEVSVAVMTDARTDSR